MDKPDSVCPSCRAPSKLWREVNAVIEFWECENKHVFSVEKKPPPRLSAAATAAAAAREAQAAESAISKPPPPGTGTGTEEKT